MRLTLATLSLGILACLCLAERKCEPDQMHFGCKIVRSSCDCTFGCKNDYIYESQEACLSAVTKKRDRHERSANNCRQFPCRRGICVQTTKEPGFLCKCEGTGFYGQRCERACPTVPMRGLVFPYECIVI